jgi:hypothetical protein
LPLLLNFLTVYFLVAGCVLLWLNLRPRRPRIVITKADQDHQSAPTPYIPIDPEIHALLASLKPPASEAQTNPKAEDAQALAKRIVEGWQKAEQPTAPTEGTAAKP